MRLSYPLRFLSTLFALACLLPTNNGNAQVTTAEAPAKLTTAEEVLARYVEVTGGKKNYEAVKGIYQEAEISLAAAGIEGTMSMSFGGPDRLRVDVDMSGIGKELQGVNGEIGWADSMMTGTRLVTGKELDQLKSQADMRQYYDPSEIYEKMEMAEPATIDDEECYVLELTTKGGDLKQEYFSIKTGLKLKSKMTVQSAMGELPIETSFSDYRESGGIKHPMKIAQALPNGMEMEIEVKKLEINPEFKEGTFDLPEKVQKLVDQQKKDK